MPHELSQVMSARKRLVETDADADEASVGEDVNYQPKSNSSGSPCPDSTGRSSSIKPKETTSTSVVGGRAGRRSDRPDHPKEGVGGLVYYNI